MWSSHGLTPYLGYTIHWIDSDWNLKTIYLGTRHVPEDHTASNLAERMHNVLSYWKLDEEKQVAITTDNRANINKACRDSKWTNVLCFGHNLHLAITNTLANKTRTTCALKVCKKVVAAFGTSLKKRRDLAAAQLQEEPGQKVKQLASISTVLPKFQG
ncbi:zinc finger BED domain-containing 1-like [Paramuricea clavata]|uniref:Zinc finger BED domain-containing 1-like n=1 Tax=Paramuricea clavata TaxID=317549 RepID=A0A7D9HZE3_PARCT|nr:zinc finger BED domain-containing 1-like [Paramuricea clavata]